MSDIEKIVEYFKSNKGYDRFMKFLRKNYQKHGYFYGNIVIEKPTEYERQALGGFMKKDFKNSSKITINLLNFLKRLKETKYSDIELKDILIKYFNENIIPENKLKEEYAFKQQTTFNTLLNLNKNTKVYLTLSDILNINGSYYTTINNYYVKSDIDTFTNTIMELCNAVNNLPESKIRLAVFAAKITKSPHKFDIKTTVGKLFILFLAKYSNVDVPRNTELIGELLYKNNILLDDVSNMVLTYGLQAMRKCDNEEEIQREIKFCTTSDIQIYNKHKALEYFYYNREPIQLTLYNISKLSDLVAVNCRVIVVENPNVFTAILDSDAISNKDISLICTYGQIKLAGLMLLDLIDKSGIMMYYSGDMDPEGILIADKLSKRYKNIKYIGFEKEYYLKNISNETISDSRIKSLSNVESPKLKVVSELIKENKKAAYEELNISNIIDYIKNLK